MLMEIKDSVLIKMNESLNLGGDDILRYQERLFVPDGDDMRTRIDAKAHGSKYSRHLCSTKMYHDHKQIYRWDGMMKDVAEYVAKCPYSLLFWEEHLKPGCLKLIVEISTFM